MGRPARAASQSGHIFVFGLYPGAIGALQHLDPNRIPFCCPHLDFAAGQRNPLCGVPADTRSGAVPEERFGDPIGLRRPCGHFQAEARAALLHLGGPELHVECARQEERFPQRIQVLRTQIVQIRGQEDDFTRLERRRAKDEP
jgi:hypothetical protein